MPYITCGDRRIEYEIERKDVKNINLRVRGDGSLFVSANRWVPQQKIEQFVQSKARLIEQTLDRISRSTSRPMLPETVGDGTDLVLLGVHTRVAVRRATANRVAVQNNVLTIESKTPEDPEALKAQLERYLTALSGQVFEAVCRRVYPYFEKQGVPYPKIKVREMKSRWGSCIKQKGIVTLNRQLIHAPLPCIEYVATHEFCHLIHADHSRRFYTLLESLMPDYRSRKSYLDGGRDTGRPEK